MKVRIYVVCLLADAWLRRIGIIGNDDRPAEHQSRVDQVGEMNVFISGLSR